METTRIDTYDLAALPWSRAVTQLEAASRKGDVHQSFWLATVDADGAPHMAAVGSAGRHPLAIRWAELTDAGRRRTSRGAIWRTASVHRTYP
jgi:hypothetical protein